MYKSARVLLYFTKNKYSRKFIYKKIVWMQFFGIQGDLTTKEGAGIYLRNKLFSSIHLSKRKRDAIF